LNNYKDYGDYWSKGITYYLNWGRLFFISIT
jgi:hypothetical protein